MSASEPQREPPEDQRAAAWERRLRGPVIAAALAVLPLMALHLSAPEGALATIEAAAHWAIWVVFAVEVAIMLAVVRDRRAWVDGHRIELLVVVASAPLLPLALAVAPALRLLVVVKLFKSLKLAKAIKLAKLGKGARVVRRRLAPRGPAALALAAAALALALALVAYMVTGAAPLRGDRGTVALLATGALATYGVARLRRRAA